MIAPLIRADFVAGSRRGLRPPASRNPHARPLSYQRALALGGWSDDVRVLAHESDVDPDPIVGGGLLWAA
jgi:hypothetical protein